MPKSETTKRRRASTRNAKISRRANAGAASARKERNVSLSLLQVRQAELIHEAVKKILWEVGVIIDHDAVRNRLLDSHGCRMSDQGYVRMPPDLIDTALSTVPDRITLYDLDGNLSVDTKAKTSSYCPGHNCVRLLDHRTGELRPCTLDDIRTTAKVCEKLPNIDMVCTLGYPSDVPAEDEAVEATRAMLENSRKPAAILAHDEHIQERIVTLASDVVGGRNNLADKPIILELMGPISPLRLPDEYRFLR